MHSPIPPAKQGVAALVLFLATALPAPLALASVDSRLAVFGYARTVPVESIPDHVIDKWKYLDDRNALIVRRGQAYLLAMTSPCPALQTAGVIAFNAAIGGLVPARSLQVGQGATATECRVDQIVRLERRGLR